MKTTYTSYDSSEVEASLCAYISNPGQSTFPRFYSALMSYGIVRSKAFLRPHQHWLDEASAEFSSEDLFEYFSIRLLKYIDTSKAFNPTLWLSNPMGCLGTYFQSRAKDFLRKAFRFQSSHVQQDDEAGVWQSLSARCQNPEEQFEASEQKLALSDALKNLPVDLSRIVKAKWFDQKSSSQISKEFSMPITKVYEATKKAKTILKFYMQDYLSA